MRKKAGAVRGQACGCSRWRAKLMMKRTGAMRQGYMLLAEGLRRAEEKECVLDVVQKVVKVWLLLPLLVCVASWRGDFKRHIATASGSMSADP